jgi:hypothetical protein
MYVYLYVDVHEHPRICVYARTSRHKRIKYVCTHVCMHEGAYVGLWMFYMARRRLHYNGI